MKKERKILVSSGNHCNYITILPVIDFDTESMARWYWDVKEERKGKRDGIGEWIFKSGGRDELITFKEDFDHGVRIKIIYEE